MHVIADGLERGRDIIMKKYVSLLLVAIILMTAIMLTSCDVAKVILGIFDLIEEDNTDNDVDININLGGNGDKEHVHTVGIIPAVEATCTSTGLTEGQYCLSCEKVLVEQREIPLRAHTEVVDSSVAATCTATGLTEGKHCATCNKTLVAQQETPMTAHEYTDKYDENCNRCGFVRDAECAHTETETINGYDATCTSTGLTNGLKCKKCGEIVKSQEVIQIKSHTEVIDAAVEATCTSTGLTQGKHCSVCGTITLEQAEIPIKAHTEVVDSAIDATCTNEGITEGKHCSVCSVVLVAQKPTPVISHSYDDKYDDNCNVCGFIREAECAHKETLTLAGYAATCTSTGLTNGSKCKKCGVILTAQEIIAVKPHTEVVDAAIEATCTTAGLTEGKHCSVCYLVIVSQEVIPATGHNLGEWVIVRNPTVNEEGVKERYCSCGMKEAESIDRLIPSEGLEFELNSDYKSYKVMGRGSCTDTDIVIPDTYNGLPVTIIYTDAFRNDRSLTSVVIPNSVTIIWDSAFSSCTKLKSVEIPDSVTRISGYVFDNCISLTSIVIPDSVTTIGHMTFERCTSLTIYCEVNSKPSGWTSYWNYSNCPVVWGYTGE